MPSLHSASTSTVRAVCAARVFLLAALAVVVALGLPDSIHAEEPPRPSAVVIPEIGDCSGPRSISGEHFPPRVSMKVFHLHPSGEESFVGENETNAAGTFSMPFPPGVAIDCTPGASVVFEVRVVDASDRFTGVSARAEFTIDDGAAEDEEPQGGKAGLAAEERGLSAGEGVGLAAALAAVLLLGRYASSGRRR